MELSFYKRDQFGRKKKSRKPGPAPGANPFMDGKRPLLGAKDRWDLGGGWNSPRADLARWPHPALARCFSELLAPGFERASLQEPALKLPSRKDALPFDAEDSWPSFP